MASNEGQSRIKRPVTVQRVKIYLELDTGRSRSLRTELVTCMTNAGVFNVNENLIRSWFLNIDILEVDRTPFLFEDLGLLRFWNFEGHGRVASGVRLNFRKSV